MEIRTIAPGDIDHVLAAGHLFDDVPVEEWTASFLGRDGHHLLIAYVDQTPAGFVTGIEVCHPDKGNEMLLYELGVDEAFRRRGIARALIEALAERATQLDCRSMWVPVDADNEVAIATYRASGFDPPEPTVILERRLR